MPFEEKGLNELFDEVKRVGTFHLVSQIHPADIFIIAVPTPQENGEADLTFVLKAIDEIGKVLKDGDTIVVESTVGPVDCEKRIIPYLERLERKFHFASCPERAIPGNTLYEMVNNARVVGGLTEEDSAYVKGIYSSFVKGEIYTTTPTIASTCKVMENTYRNVNIALADTFVKIADEIGFNVWEAIELANKHPRVNIHQPGPGVGGHCIPIDPWFFAALSKHSQFIVKALNINNQMPEYVVDQLEKIIRQNNLLEPVIGVLGFAYKKNIDDARETPSKEILDLLKEKFTVILNDPYVKQAPHPLQCLEELLKEAEVVVLTTDHDEYKNIRFSDYPNIKIVYDTRNLFISDNIKDSLVKLYKMGVGMDENPYSN